jgi:hypothetical protein
LRIRSSSAECNNADHYFYEVPVNAGNSDRTYSGATGADCGAPNADGDDTAPSCAAGHAFTLTSQSNQTDTRICQLVLEENWPAGPSLSSIAHSGPAGESMTRPLIACAGVGEIT